MKSCENVLKTWKTLEDSVYSCITGKFSNQRFFFFFGLGV